MTTAVSIAPSSSKRSSKASENNDQIRFTTGRCSLGLVLVATSPKGVCALSFGDSPVLLEADLRKRFPKAEFSEVDVSEDPTIARVIDFVETPGAKTEFPLDLRGTDFQQLVWKALRKIPSGETSDYTKIAAKTGRPKAVRAVAQACASNPVAVVVPCHRVLRRDGSLSGYRWGIDRKEKLLQMERKAG